MFCNPDTFEPVVTFLSLKGLLSQDANGIKSANDAAFNDISMPELGKKIKSGLAVKFRETGFPWLAFVWCLSHRFELALKDNLEKLWNLLRSA